MPTNNVFLGIPFLNLNVKMPVMTFSQKKQISEHMEAAHVQSSFMIQYLFHF